MKMMNKVVIGATVALALVVMVHAQQSPMGDGMGPDMMWGQMMQGQMMGQNANMKIMRELMSPAERLAMMDKMIDAKTVEARQAIMTATHTEMGKRAKEKGITLPVEHGPQMMSGRTCG